MFTHMNRLARKFGRPVLATGVAIVATAVPALAAAAVDADVKDALDSSILTWNVIKGGMITVGVFLIAWGLLKKFRRA